ncbi:MAG: hypothetical protein RX318_00810 [bacterium]|nr:hypothetical protein [bacterium]
MSCRIIFRFAIVFVVSMALDVGLGVYSSAWAQGDAGLTDMAKRLGSLQYKRGVIVGGVERMREEHLKEEPREPFTPPEEAPEHLKYMWMHAQSKERALTEEAVVKYGWMKVLVSQAEESFEKAKSASNPTVAQYWLKDARSRADRAERLVGMFLGPPAESRPPPTSEARPTTGLSPTGETQRTPKPTPKKPKLKPMTGFSSGILYQMKLHDERLQFVQDSSDPKILLEQAVKDFGEGRAGAGGISLYKAATLITPLDMSKARRAVFEDGRLLLLYGNRRIAFPPLDPEYLALAIRSIYGGEGLVRGKLITEEPNAVVIKTGREQFGDLVWKKEFLPSPWAPVPVGRPVGLSLGPGLGALSQPEPSMDRITYYGPIKNTRMGKVLLEADMLLFTLITGVDWRTGLPLPTPNVEGFMTSLERGARRAHAPAAKEKKERPPEKATDEKKWWHEGTWFVWVPGQFTLRLARGGKAFEFVEARMKLATWSVIEENVDSDDKGLARHTTEHYQELARAFPVLKDLEEVAKAVTVVRWLKKNNVPADLSWAKGYRIQKVDTPENVRRFVVLTEKDKSGKPWIEKPSSQ